MTVLVTVSIDLMVGIGAGIITEITVCIWFVKSHSKQIGSKFSWVKFTRGLFKVPVTHREMINRDYHIQLNGLVVCFNRLGNVLAAIPEEAQSVHIHFEQVFLMDPTSWAQLQQFIKEHGNVFLHGVEELRPLSLHSTATRIRMVY